MQYYRQQKFPGASDIFMNALNIFQFQFCYTSYDVINKKYQSKKKGTN